MVEPSWLGLVPFKREMDSEFPDLKLYLYLSPPPLIFSPSPLILCLPLPSVTLFSSLKPHIVEEGRGKLILPGPNFMGDLL